jgi:hypothetical protein
VSSTQPTAFTRSMAVPSSGLGFQLTDPLGRDTSVLLDSNTSHPLLGQDASMTGSVHASSSSAAQAASPTPSNVSRSPISRPESAQVRQIQESLSRRYIQQLLYGCERHPCPNPDCASNPDFRITRTQEIASLAMTLSRLGSEHLCPSIAIGANNTQNRRI